jgi:hypothetical protein
VLRSGSQIEKQLLIEVGGTPRDLRKPAVADPEAAAPLFAEQSCRLTNDGYIEALVKKHGSDERYRNFFRKNSVEAIGNLLRQCLAPALLDVLDRRREDDLAA